MTPVWKAAAAALALLAGLALLWHLSGAAVGVARGGRLLGIGPREARG